METDVGSVLNYTYFRQEQGEQEFRNKVGLALCRLQEYNLCTNLIHCQKTSAVQLAAPELNECVLHLIPVLTLVAGFKVGFILFLTLR